MHDARDLSMREITPALFPLTWEAVRAGLTDGVAPGMVAGFWRASEPASAWVLASGERRRYPSSLPMRADTVFDLASVSKVFGTATLAALLIERRWLSWDAPLKGILPAYPGGEGITLRHLLSHTAGLPAWAPLWEKLRAHFAPLPLQTVPVAERQREMRRLVFEILPEAPAGERAVYSDISFLLLGFALEEVTGLPLDEAVATQLWKPLGLASAFYRRTTKGVEAARLSEVAATEDCPWRAGMLQGQVHDDNCWAMGGYAGHAGAFADARDVLHFAGRLLSGYLSKQTLQMAWTRMAQPAGCSRTPGWDTPSGDLPSAGRLFSPLSVGHLGYTGTSLWIDPEAGLAVTLLTNRVHPSRENQKIREFRPKFHEALRRDILALTH